MDYHVYHLIWSRASIVCFVCCLLFIHDVDKFLEAGGLSEMQAFGASV